LEVHPAPGPCPDPKARQRDEEVAKLNLTIPSIFNPKMKWGIAQSFNQMIKQLKVANEANQEWSSTLEKKVQRKSEELKKAQAIFSSGKDCLFRKTFCGGSPRD